MFTFSKQNIRLRQWLIRLNFADKIKLDEMGTDVSRSTESLYGPVCVLKLKRHLFTVWPDWAIYWNFDRFLKPLATFNLPKSPTFLGNFVKESKSIIFIVKSFLGSFYWRVAIFFWSHWWSVTARRGNKRGVCSCKREGDRLRTTHTRMQLSVVKNYSLVQWEQTNTGDNVVKSYLLTIILIKFMH